MRKNKKDIKEFKKIGNNLIGLFNDNTKFNIDLSNMDNVNVSDSDLLIILKYYNSEKYIPNNVSKILSDISYFFTNQAVEYQALADISVDAAYKLHNDLSLSKKILSCYDDDDEIIKLASDNLKKVLSLTLSKKINDIFSNK